MNCIPNHRRAHAGRAGRKNLKKSPRTTVNPLIYRKFHSELCRSGGWSKKGYFRGSKRRRRRGCTLSIDEGRRLRIYAVEVEAQQLGELGDFLVSHVAALVDFLLHHPGVVNDAVAIAVAQHRVAVNQRQSALAIGDFLSQNILQLNKL